MTKKVRFSDFNIPCVRHIVSPLAREGDYQISIVKSPEKCLKNGKLWHGGIKPLSPNPLLMYSANVKDSENAGR